MGMYNMRLFECTPGMEVSGRIAMALLTNLQADTFRPFLEKHGFAEIVPDQWYPFQNLLNLFKEVSQQPGAMFDFVAVGIAAVDRYTLPPEVAALTLEQFFLTVLPRVTAGQYRNGETTAFVVEALGERHLAVKVSTPYPGDIAYGFLYGFALRFLPRGRKLALKYAEGKPRHDQGGPETVFDLTWR